MNFSIEAYFHKILNVRYRMIRTKMVPTTQFGNPIEVQDDDYEPRYFWDRSQAEQARTAEIANADFPVCGISDFINLPNRDVATYFAHEIATIEDGCCVKAFLALPAHERACFRIRYVESVICPARRTIPLAA